MSRYPRDYAGETADPITGARWGAPHASGPPEYLAYDARPGRHLVYSCPAHVYTCAAKADYSDGDILAIKGEVYGQTGGETPTARALSAKTVVFEFDVTGTHVPAPTNVKLTIATATTPAEVAALVAAACQTIALRLIAFRAAGSTVVAQGKRPGWQPFWGVATGTPGSALHVAPRYLYAYPSLGGAGARPGVMLPALALDATTLARGALFYTGGQGAP